MRFGAVSAAVDMMIHINYERNNDKVPVHLPFSLPQQIPFVGFGTTKIARMRTSILTFFITTVLSALLTDATSYPANTSSNSSTTPLSSSCITSSSIGLSNITESLPNPVGDTM